MTSSGAQTHFIVSTSAYCTRVSICPREPGVALTRGVNDACSCRDRVRCTGVARRAPGKSPVRARGAGAARRVPGEGLERARGAGVARPARPQGRARGARPAHRLRVGAGVHGGLDAVDLRGGEEGVDGVEAGDVAVEIVSG